MKRKIVLLLLLVFSIGLLSACTEVGDDDDDTNNDPSSYTVTFLGLNDEVLRTTTVQPGANANAPRNPWVKGYHFVGWDRNFIDVQSDLEVRAIFEAFDENTTLHQMIENIIGSSSYTEFTEVYADGNFNRNILAQKDGTSYYMELNNPSLDDPIKLYMFISEQEEYMMYELQEGEWIGDDYGDRMFYSFIRDHTQLRQLPLGFFTDWFNVSGNVYTLKSAHFADLQAQIPMDGVFSKYVLTLNSNSLDLHVQIRMGSNTVDYYVTYSNINSTAIDVDIE